MQVSHDILWILIWTDTHSSPSWRAALSHELHFFHKTSAGVLNLWLRQIVSQYWWTFLLGKDISMDEFHLIILSIAPALFFQSFISTCFIPCIHCFSSQCRISENLLNHALFLSDKINFAFFNMENHHLFKLLVWKLQTESYQAPELFYLNQQVPWRLWELANFCRLKEEPPSESYEPVAFAFWTLSCKINNYWETWPWTLMNNLFWRSWP